MDVCVVLEIFKLGMSFKNACDNYLHYNKVIELQHEIDHIKESFLYNALDLVKKASICENKRNIPFFIESAYSNFSQSVRLLSGCTEQMVSSLIISGIKLGPIGILKSNHQGRIADRCNSIIDKIENKVSASDQTEIDQLEKELKFLELSYLGQAMCEYYLGEISLCMKSVDSAIGVVSVPWYKYLNKLYQASSAMSFLSSYRYTGAKREADLSRERTFYRKMFIEAVVPSCIDYLKVLTVVAKENEASLEEMQHRNKIVEILRETVDNPQSCMFDFEKDRLVRFLDSIENP